MFEKNQGGFTLLEVVLAMMIIGIITVPLMGLYSGSQQRYDRSTESTIAVNLAQQKMEEIVGSELNSYVDNSDSWTEFPGSSGYFYQVDVIPPEVGSELEKDKLNLYTIDVKVQYQAGGKNQQIAVSTYLADR